MEYTSSEKQILSLMERTDFRNLSKNDVLSYASKLNDMAECRNKIAHNNYVDDIERNLMKTYYNVILRQISDSVDK